MPKINAFEEISEGIEKIQRTSQAKGKNALIDSLTKKVARLIKTNFAVGSKSEMDKNAGYNKAIRDVLEILKDE